MRLAPNEPPCLVEGLSHAWVPLRTLPHHATCGRCYLTRVAIATSYTYVEPRPIVRNAD